MLAAAKQEAWGVQITWCVDIGRGTEGLEIPLKLRNFRVHLVSIDAAAVDATDREKYDMLFHRVLITKRSKDFLEAAAIHEFDIMDTAQAAKDPEKLADIISREWLAGSLRVRQPCIARIRADGSVPFREIEE